MTRIFKMFKLLITAVLITGTLAACSAQINTSNAQWVPGHYNRNGAWVPGHYMPGAVGPATGGPWVPGHYNRWGGWVPGHSA